MVLEPQTGRDAAVFIASGADQEFSDDALEEVNATALGYPRYTVYQPANSAKRVFNDNEVPVVQFDTGGDNNFAAVTPQEIQYSGGWIILSSARGATDQGRIHSGHYLVISQALGALTWKKSGEWETEKVIFLGDSGPSIIPLYKKWSATVEQIWARAQASLSTNLTGDNNDLTLTHEGGGAIGNLYNLTLVDPGGNNQPLVVTALGYNITASLATNAGGAITTTALQLMNAINASVVLSGKKIRAALKAGNNGSGVCTAMSQTYFSGGADAVNYSDIDEKIVAALFIDTSGGEKYIGFCTIATEGEIDAGKLVKQTLKLDGTAPLYYRPPTS